MILGNEAKVPGLLGGIATAHLLKLILITVQALSGHTKLKKIYFTLTDNARKLKLVASLPKKELK